MVSVIINLVTGAIGGNVAGRVFRNLNLGTLGNSVAGILGGGLGGQLIHIFGISAGPSGSLDPAAILGSVASGGIGGGVVLAIFGFIRKAMK